jgi:hypothetical protein
MAIDNRSDRSTDQRLAGLEAKRGIFTGWGGREGGREERRGTSAGQSLIIFFRKVAVLSSQRPAHRG